jgi:hypothetical protein
MGAGIAVIVFGVAFGALMAAVPKGIWWATEAWKFRNPTANEPSDAAYAMTRLGGVALIIGAVVLGAVFIRDARAQAAADRLKQEAAQAEANFVVPPPERRGVLPVLGYQAEPPKDGEQFVKVYYLAPEGAVPESYRTMTTSISEINSFPCYAKPTETHRPDGGIDFVVELIWAPRLFSDTKFADDCRFGRRHRIDDVSVGRLPTTASVLTDGPIASVDGLEIRAAAADNAVPLLKDKPPDEALTVSDRGAIPIVGYRVDGGKLAVTYLLPEGADARGGDFEGTPAGCEVVPVMTGLGSGTVTVDLRLRFANPNRYYGDDDEKCRVSSDTTWSSYPSTTKWGDVSTSATVLTNGPIVDGNGDVVAAAAPGNRVPRR